MKSEIHTQTEAEIEGIKKQRKSLELDEQPIPDETPDREWTWHESKEKSLVLMNETSMPYVVLWVGANKTGSLPVTEGTYEFPTVPDRLEDIPNIDGLLLWSDTTVSKGRPHYCTECEESFTADQWEVHIDETAHSGIPLHFSADVTGRATTNDDKSRKEDDNEW